ncbi:hypothetical protein BKA70DRAFT_1217374 [Coprinopsis sp. MPI-PUGE-AT-0042]|nr:hypothetical protein BKA70DRAFT_1217374 [Coprinopsis sp. MPI-PUGE-AT-0042]
MKVDKAVSTSKTFGGLTPSVFDPGLLNNCNKRKIIESLKKKQAPFGSGTLEGVMHLRHIEAKLLPRQEQYIHNIISERDYELVVTLLPELAMHVHDADVTLHDNTYKHVHGEEWKEWEPEYIALTRTGRLFVACGKSWDSVKQVTGKPVQFKFLDGVGIKAILVNGCKAQVQGCSDNLLEHALKRSWPDLAGQTADDIVQYIVQTCVVHLDWFIDDCVVKKPDRKFDKMDKVLPTEIMDRIRGFCFLETKQEVDEFVHWCLDSKHSVLKNWMADKVPYPWAKVVDTSQLSKVKQAEKYCIQWDDKSDGP